MPKHSGAESRAWGHDQPFLPHLLPSPAPWCLQRVRQHKPRALLTALFPGKSYEEPWGARAHHSPGAGVVWGTPPHCHWCHWVTSLHRSG